jgi:putative membrane protein
VPWLKLLHIAAVIVWCGALLYLPAAIAAAAGPDRAAAFDRPQRHLLRGLFTAVATPAALVAIASGTAIFLWQGPLAPWLMAKLTVVGLLVLTHATCGLLILRTERQPRTPLRGACLAVGLLSLVWLGGIAWLVLRKPF